MCTTVLDLFMIDFMLNLLSFQVKNILFHTNKGMIIKKMDDLNLS